MKFEMSNRYTFEQFQQISLPEKSQFFSNDGWLFDLVYSQQLSRQLLDELYVLTNKIRLISKTTEGSRWLGSLLSSKKAMLYFIQPSTRTFLSFQTACETLGMKVSDVRSTSTSSEVKGESFADTIRTFSSYFDLIVMRHPQAGCAEQASFVLNNTRRPIPVINAGSGKDEHPTQGLLDIFTLKKSFSSTGGLKNKTIMMVGDLKRGRTVRSLCQLLAQFEDIKIIFSSPKELEMNPDLYQFLDNAGVKYEVTNGFVDWVPLADAIYMTRIQDEWDEEGDKKIDVTEWHFKEEHLKLLKSNAVILHPLPRRLEIEESVDNDPRAMYWRQVRNGMWVRVALIAHIFRLNRKILDR